MKYRFVFKDGWWLKISTTEELQKYYDEVDSNRMAKAFENLIHSKEFFSKSDKDEDDKSYKSHATRLAYVIGLHAENNHMSAIRSTLDLQERKFLAQAEQLINGYNIYINRNGGWHFGKNDYVQWRDSDVLVFPDFKKDQIKIERFPGGKHFYAYIDDMQVRDGDTLKWDTYEEAYKQAEKYVSKEKILA